MVHMATRNIDVTERATSRRRRKRRIDQRHELKLYPSVDNLSTDTCSCLLQFQDFFFETTPRLRQVEAKE